uniref:Glutaredoxin and cysteine rich domain containing 2 n=1 Tax=Cyanoderma ruficeps TaxID=181631 RepID=A0A8C3RGB6_9PASS
MDEPQKKPSQRHEGRPRKVRFKISSAYSGRVLKQVYEDGQELEPPAKEHSRRFLRHSFEPAELCGPGELPQGGCCWPTALTAQRISVLREDPKRGPLLSDCPPGAVVDFGKIIIYTNNLKIIRAPMDQKDNCDGKDGETEFSSFENIPDFGISHPLTEFFSCCLLQEGNADHGCSQCKGSGCAPCSLCHGSKFSMLANRFRESYRALRCPACDETGLQPCRVCAA